MCRWKVTKGAVACSGPLSCLFSSSSSPSSSSSSSSPSSSSSSCVLLLLLLFLALSALPAASCHDGHRSTRSPRSPDNHNSSGASSATAVVGRHVRSYDHLQGDVRKRKLFSYQKFFLRIDKNGKVNGTKNDKDPFTIFEIKSVEVGIVAIRGLHSTNYLALTKKGTLYGAKEFGVDCMWTERIEENKYNTYASVEHKNKKKFMFVGLSVSGKPMRGKKTRRKNTATHFLPIPVDPQS
ncbi:hypothetical protein AALO_G00161040 [Alosa alosa]|uniref:Fibroblast growth factor n=1 Tax=Alosa alosa TaxID=278164 RepID=A0AAV6GA87_9TELE|nr:fibroblast growth factor 10a [Alosa alosa]KAG5272044.1 hypothetical protein AALO_G00161040 [Alosa alosa]